MSGEAHGPHVPIEDREQLLAYFRDAEKPPEAWRVGTEHEKIGLHADTLAPVPYEGERGIGALLERVAELDDWEIVREAGLAIALLKDGASITLEPGGQLELSGAPLRTIHETCDEFHSHLALMKRACEPMGILFLGLGIDPLHPIEARPRMPKARYRIMRDYLPTRGDLALEMMHMTATVQANFDYESESDMATKLRTAYAVTPLVSALFANSSISSGKPNGFISKRIHIWTRTDPDRTGIPPWIQDPDLGYATYAEWALDVPMFFVVRDGTYRPAEGMTFRTFLEKGFGELRPTLADWDLHLTTIFPEVRLKRFIEVRGADAVPPGLTCCLPALWKGILYDATALGAAAELMADARPEERGAALDAVARRGLAAEIGGAPILPRVQALVDIAGDGLRRIAHAGSRDPDETGFLDAAREQLALGRSPGQVILENWEGAWARAPQRLIEYARY